MAVTVISYLTEDVAQQGLFAIPCLIGTAAASKPQTDRQTDGQTDRRTN